MLKYPAHSSGIAFRIAGASDGIESEVNAEKSADGPVRDSVAEEVEENPGRDHGDNGGSFRGSGAY